MMYLFNFVSKERDFLSFYSKVFFNVVGVDTKHIIRCVFSVAKLKTKCFRNPPELKLVKASHM